MIFFSVFSSVIDLLWGRKVGKVRLGTTVLLFWYLFKVSKGEKKKRSTSWLSNCLSFKRNVAERPFFHYLFCFAPDTLYIGDTKKAPVRNTPDFAFFLSRLHSAGSQCCACGCCWLRGCGSKLPTGSIRSGAAMSSGDSVQCLGKWKTSPPPPPRFH